MTTRRDPAPARAARRPLPALQRVRRAERAVFRWCMRRPWSAPPWEWPNAASRHERPHDAALLIRWTHARRVRASPPHRAALRAGMAHLLTARQLAAWQRRASARGWVDQAAFWLEAALLRAMEDAVPVAWTVFRTTCEDALPRLTPPMLAELLRLADPSIRTWLMVAVVPRIGDASEPPCRASLASSRAREPPRWVRSCLRDAAGRSERGYSRRRLWSV